MLIEGQVAIDDDSKILDCGKILARKILARFRQNSWQDLAIVPIFRKDRGESLSNVQSRGACISLLNFYTHIFELQTA